MQVRLTLRMRGAPDRDAAIEGPSGAVLSDVPVLDPDWSASTVGWWSGTRRLAPGAAIGGPGLRDGDIIGVGGVGHRDPTAGAVLLMHAVGGPDAGAMWALPAGTLIIGRADDADIRLIDGDVSRRHASLTVTASGARLRDLESTNGVLVDGRPIGSDGAALAPDQLVRIGGTILWLATAVDAPAALRPDDDGRLLVNRPPRLPLSHDVPGVAFPDRPGARLLGSPRLTGILAPAVVAVLVATILRSPVFLLLAVLSPLAVVGTLIGDRLAARRGRRRDSRSFRREEALAEEKRDQLLAAEASLRRREHPDPAAVRLIARGPTSRLWERRSTDADFLDVRVGLGDAPARLALTRGTAPMPAPTLALIPRFASLRDGPLGICGSTTVARAAARWAVLQLAALHSTADLRIVALLADEPAEDWRWLRWLPHTASIAIDASSRRLLVQQLQGASRQQPERRRETARAPGSGLWTVMVIDRAGEVAHTPGLARLLRDGTSAGITAICVDRSTGGLPTACASVLRLDAAATGAVLVGSSHGATPILADGLRRRFAEEAARDLARLGDPTDDRSTIPSSCTVADVLGRGAFSPTALARRWAASDGIPRAAIGVGACGPCEVDLVHDGPHALVAGTTGSGKSELLQSLVAGLAAACSPEDLAFVLIDYKGGAAFAQCAALPHTTGLVTDLDQSLSERALRSLHAELRRREAILAGAGAADLAAYRATRKQNDEALPRIVVIVDEFAALAEELPSFVGGLVGVAQRGRSLGVHLVLATQRPSGVVSPEIRANANLRVALRVTDPSESRDVIGVDDAAHLPRAQPGRALVRVGASGDPPYEMQTAHAGAPSQADHAVLLRWLDGWGRPIADDVAGSTDAGAATQLGELVRAAREAARHLPPPRPPWLPPLPELLTPADTGRLASPGSIVLGLVDLPDEQAQAPLLVDVTGGTTLIVGAARSGRTSALRWVAHQASADRTCELHALDCASGQLHILEASRRCGIYAAYDDVDAMRAALSRLCDVLSARRAGGSPDHHCIVLIDGVDAALAALEAADPGQGADQLLSMLRDAQSGGMTVVATADRPALAGRLGSVFATKILLRLNDPTDYTLAGIPARLVPSQMRPGRGLLAPGGDAAQLAVLHQDPIEQNRILRMALTAPRPADAPSMTRLRALPRRVELAQSSGASQRAPGEIILGVGGDGANPVSLPLLSPGAARLLIVGPPGSGRSSTLALIADQLSAQRIPTALVAAPGRAPTSAPAATTVLEPRRSAPWNLADLGDPRVVLIDDCPALGSTDLDAWLADLVLSRPDIAFVGTGRADELAAAFRGVGMALARFRSGVLLCPSPTDPDLFGLRRPRTRAPFRPGRGILVGPDGLTPIQVATLAGPHSPQTGRQPQTRNQPQTRHQPQESG